MDMKDKFEIIRQAIQADTHAEAKPVALAAIDIAEEFLSKLERIAVATEAVASTVMISPGSIPAVQTRDWNV
jgi:hypothetical protein